MNDNDTTPASRAGQARPRRRTAWRALALAAVALALFILVLMLLGSAMHYFQGHPGELQRVGATSAAVKRWGFVVQGALIAAMGIWWRRLVDLGLRLGIVSTDEYERALGYRWRVVAFCIAYLLLIVLGPSELWAIVAH